MVQSWLPASLPSIIPITASQTHPFIRTPRCHWGNHSLLGSCLWSHVSVFSSLFDYPPLFLGLVEGGTESVKERKGIWSLEWVYFWRSRGRVRAASFLVFYCFLCTLEVDLEQEFTPGATAVFRLAAAWSDAGAERFTWKRERVLNKNCFGIFVLESNKNVLNSTFKAIQKNLYKSNYEPHTAFSRCWTLVGWLRFTGAGNLKVAALQQQPHGLLVGTGTVMGDIHTPGQRCFITQVHKKETNQGKIKFISTQLANDGVQLSVAAPLNPPSQHSHLRSTPTHASRHRGLESVTATQTATNPPCGVQHQWLQENERCDGRANPAVHGDLQSWSLLSWNTNNVQI